MPRRVVAFNTDASVMPIEEPDVDGGYMDGLALLEAQVNAARAAMAGVAEVAKGMKRSADGQMTALIAENNRLRAQLGLPPQDNLAQNLRLAARNSAGGGPPAPGGPPTELLSGAHTEPPTSRFSISEHSKTSLHSEDPNNCLPGAVLDESEAAKWCNSPKSSPGGCCKTTSALTVEAMDKNSSIGDSDARASCGSGEARKGNYLLSLPTSDTEHNEPKSPRELEMREASKSSSQPAAKLKSTKTGKKELQWVQAATHKNQAMRELYSDSIWTHISQSQTFEQVTLLVIAFNALWISIDIDNNDEPLLVDADVGFQIVQHLFCTFFSLELLVRFLAFEHKINCAKDAWFVFDGTLLLLMVLETWVMPFLWLIFSNDNSLLAEMSNASVLRILRLVRITRMARMARLVKAVPELLVMVKGLWAAARSVCVTLVMLVMIVYVFSITFRLILGDTDVGTKYFADVPFAMNTLVGYGIFMEQTPELLTDLGREGFFYWCVFILYALLASFTVLNMLVGVMCETVRTVSSAEHERHGIVSAKEKLEGMLKTSGLDANGDGMISKQELSALLEIPGAAKALGDVGVDASGLVDLSDFIFEEAEELEFDEFMSVVLRLRGSNTATVRDLVDLRRYLRVENSRLHATIRLEGVSRRNSRNSTYHLGMEV